MSKYIIQISRKPNLIVDNPNCNIVNSKLNFIEAAFPSLKKLAFRLKV